MHLYRILFGLSMFTVSFGSSIVVSADMPHGEVEHMHAGMTRKAICRGFLVLENGYAVMSGMSEAGSGMHGHRDHGGMEMQQPAGAKMAESAMPGTTHEVGAERHLMGLMHGGEYPAGAGMLCVPVDRSTQSWTAVSNAKNLHVTAKSLKGALNHNSRGNEAFEILVMDDNEPVEDAEVALIARMPQHDRSIKGGHGVANDPDAKGIEAKPSGQGRYTVQTVDFSMPGSWLFEVDVARGAKVSKAYFATNVGEE